MEIKKSKSIARETQTHDYKIFSIDICQNCFIYRFNHDPNLVFHRIDSGYLENQQSPIIYPKGTPEAPFYFYYLKYRALHLGPLSITGPLQQKNNQIWFGFNINSLKDPKIKYLNYPIWEDLHFHANAHPESERKEMESRLFLPEYSTRPITEILLPALDCSQAEFIIARNPEDIIKAERFAKKKLESVVFDLDTSKKIWDNYTSHLENSNEEWQRFLHEPCYDLPKCGCRITN